MTRARDLSKGLQKTVFKFSGDTGQTTFTTADDSTALSYTVGLIDVYYNGVKLAESEYTATNGTSVILDSGVEDDDIIEVIAVGSHSFTGGGDMNGSKLILDTDGDTSIHADTDDQIDIEIAGADDFQIVANNFKVLSGSTLTIESGATITNNGTASGSFGGTAWQAVKTGNYTASAGEGVFMDTTSAALTLTLPASPSIGDEVAFKDYAKTFDTNNLTIARNGSKIEGATNDLTVDVEGAGNTLVFTDSTQGWLLRNK